jgi:chemotaxis protein methyltransferase CheR
MTDEELALFSQFVASASGICLDRDKRYLLEGRLDEVATQLGCKTFSDLHAKVRTEGATARRVIDAISTHETSFFRDNKAFDLLKLKLVPDLLGETPHKPLSIWSAASSTGQEAYSLAMSMEEILFDLSKCRIRILGSDISEAAVNAANRGEFSALEVGRGLDAKRIAKYFTHVEGRYRVRDDLRSLCRFEVDNLLRPRAKGPFDVILCRNVLIYFSKEDKAKALSNVLAVLKKDGFLIVGATESLLGATDRVRRLDFRGSSYYALR